MLATTNMGRTIVKSVLRVLFIVGNPVLDQAITTPVRVWGCTLYQLTPSGGRSAALGHDALIREASGDTRRIRLHSRVQPELRVSGLTETETDYQTSQTGAPRT